MGNYRDIRTGRGQANLGQGNRNIGRDHVDNRQYRQVHNQGMYAEGNLHYRDGDYYDIQHGPTDPMDQITSGRGLGRLIAAIGIMVALAGFAGWMYVIFSGFSTEDTRFNPMAIEIMGYPVMVVGFAAIAVGGVITSIGSSMAKTARHRYNRTMQHRRRQH